MQTLTGTDEKEQLSSHTIPNYSAKVKLLHYQKQSEDRLTISLVFFFCCSLFTSNLPIYQTWKSGAEESTRLKGKWHFVELWGFSCDRKELFHIFTDKLINIFDALFFHIVNDPSVDPSWQRCTLSPYTRNNLDHFCSCFNFL